MFAIETKNLKKHFRDGKSVSKAVDGINLEIEKGSVYGLLGPNGAGKTTTIFMLTTLLMPMSGRASVLGYDVFREEKKIREKVGLCFGGARFNWDLKPPEILEYAARLYGIKKDYRSKKIKQLMEDLEIFPFQNKTFGDLSTGMRQKVAVAKSLINDPEVLFLDEPTSGLDVEVALSVRKYIMKLLKERDMTVILTSHQLNEVEEMCKRIAIINKGKIISEGTIREIRKKMKFPDVIRLYLSKYDVGFLKKISGVINYKVTDGLLIEVDDGLSAMKKIEPLLKKNCISIIDVEIRKASLEEVFLKVIGGGKP